MKKLILLILSVVCLLPCGAAAINVPFAAQDEFQTLLSTDYTTSPISVHSESQFEEYKNIKGATVVYFWATWCGPCRMMRPLIERMANKYKTAAFLTIDVDEVPSIAEKYSIETLPTTLFMRDGAVVDTIIGACTDDTFNSKMAKIL